MLRNFNENVSTQWSGRIWFTVLHPDKWPQDLTENQKLLLQSIWDLSRSHLCFRRSMRYYVHFIIICACVRIKRKLIVNSMQKQLLSLSLCRKCTHSTRFLQPLARNGIDCTAIVKILLAAVPQVYENHLLIQQVPQMFPLRLQCLPSTLLSDLILLLLIICVQLI